MIDNRPEVYTLLSSLGYEVDFQYPDDILDDNFPKISYYMSNSNDFDYRDSKATANEFEVVVQVWEKNVNGIFKEIYFDVNKVLEDNGYIRTYMDSVFDTDTKIYNYTFRFIKNLNY